jgi:hypothetical protein
MTAEKDKYGQPVSSADFNYNYQPINSNYPAMSLGSYQLVEKLDIEPRFVVPAKRRASRNPYISIRFWLPT